MPWNMQDYPVTFKNLDPLIRKKTIDIGNALLANKYPEERAIPIAISQAKEWYENTSDQERKHFEKEAAPKKTDKHEVDKGSEKLIDSDVTVKYVDKKWQVKSVGAKRASDSFAKKPDAVRRGKEIAQNKGSKLNIYKQNGELQQDFDFHAN